MTALDVDLNTKSREFYTVLTTLFKKQLSTIGSYEHALVSVMLDEVNRSTASLEFNHSEVSGLLSLEMVLQTSTNCPQLSCKLRV